VNLPAFSWGAISAGAGLGGLVILLLTRKWKMPLFCFVVGIMCGLIELFN
jgi:hypothetical protein